MDQKLVYRIGEAPRVAMLGGRPLTIWLNGPAVKFWIDDILFEMRYDSPPQRMPLDGGLFSFQSFSFGNELFVDSFFITKIGGAPRDIMLKVRGCLRFSRLWKEIRKKLGRLWDRWRERAAAYLVIAHLLALI